MRVTRLGEQHSTSEKSVVFIPQGGHTHDGENSSLLDLPKNSIRIESISIEALPSTQSAAPTSPEDVSGNFNSSRPLPPNNIVVSTSIVENGSSATISVKYANSSPHVNVTIYEIQFKKEDELTYSIVHSSTTSAKIEGLLPGVRYQVRVLAWALGGISDPSEWISVETARDTVPPAAPSGVTAQVGFKNIVLYWIAPADADVDNYTGSYEIHISDDSNFAIYTNASTSGTVVNFGDLNTGTIYYLRVRAIDISGNVGPWSSTVSATPGEIDTSDIGNNAITAVKISDGAIEAPKIAANAITAGKIAAGVVTANEIAAGTITAAKLVAGTLTSASGVFGDISANYITAGTMSANRLNGGTITGVSLNIGSGTFQVSSTGVMTASSAIITGSISSSTISGSTFTAGNLKIVTNQIEHVSNASNRIAFSAIDQISIQALGTIFLAGPVSFSSSITSTVTFAGAMFAPGMIAGLSPGDSVYRDSGNSQLYYVSSSAKLKSNIEDLETLPYPSVLNLRPVTFRSRLEVDQGKSPNKIMGFIAEEVAEVDPIYAVYRDNEPSNVDDRAILAGAVFEIQKLNSRVTALENK